MKVFSVSVLKYRAIRLLCGLLLALGSFLASGLFPVATTHAALRTGSDTILLIHGYGGNYEGTNCLGDGNYDGFSQIKSYLLRSHDVNGQQRKWGRLGDYRTIGYYNNDWGCDVNLAYDTGPDGQTYVAHCVNYMPHGMTFFDIGTVNESIYHISCELAWYIYETFGIHGWNVEIVAHSMGGLIVRNTIYQIWKNKAPQVMPPTLGGISDVVTLATPHAGITSFQSIFAEKSGSRQVQEMKQGSYFMNEMYGQAQNPQAARGTDWSMIGTYTINGAIPCDVAVQGNQATWMKGGRKTLFSGVGLSSGGSGAQCYSHESILKDQNDTNDAQFIWADNCNVVNDCTWNSATGPHSLHHMWNALWFDSW